MQVSKQDFQGTWDHSHCADSKQHYETDSLERGFVEPPNGEARDEEDNEVADKAETADIERSYSFVDAFTMLNSLVPEVCYRRTRKYVMKNSADEKRYHDST